MMFGRSYKTAVLAIVAASVATTSDAFNLKCEFDLFLKRIRIFELFLDVDCRALIDGIPSGLIFYVKAGTCVKP